MAVHRVPHSVIVQRVRDSGAAETWVVALTAIRGLFSSSFNGHEHAFCRGSADAAAVGKNYVMYSGGSDDLLRVSDFDGCGFADHLAARYAPREFCKLRKTAIDSFAAISILRAVFALPAYDTTSLWMVANTGEFVLSVRDFRIERNAQMAHANICEQLAALFGPTMKGELMMALASAGQALFTNLEEFRSIVELLIHSEMGNVDWDLLFEIRDDIVKNASMFAPPTGPGAREEDHTAWIKALAEFVDGSAGIRTDQLGNTFDRQHGEAGEQDGPIDSMESTDDIQWMY
jgi:hypothetical protein